MTPQSPFQPWMNSITVALTCHLWYHNRIKSERLIEIVGDEPVFETGLLLAGDVDRANVRRQLSRWTSVKRGAK